MNDINVSAPASLAASTDQQTQTLPTVVSVDRPDEIRTSVRLSKMSRRLEPRDFPDPPQGASTILPTTIENLEYVLQCFGVSVRYNLIKKKIEIDVPGLVGTADNRDNTTLAAITSLAALHGLAVGHISSYVEAIGDRNAYNPVADWIRSRPWDGKDRLQPFCRTVVARDDFPVDFKNTLLRKWMLSLVAAALKESGFYGRGVLTLQGPQGIGKTTWGRMLVSDEQLRDDVVKLDHHLDANNKDSILAAITHWVVEIGELDSSFKKDIARLKGFITGVADKVRRPYAKAESEYGRRTVFFATVNENNFLVDPTGNSRFWTIPVCSLDYKHSIDMQQLYAQLAVDFEAGEEWWLSVEEDRLLANLNRQHQAISSIQEKLLDLFDLSLIGDTANPYMTPTELLDKIGLDHPTMNQCKECASLLRERVGEPKRVQGRDKWRAPLRRAAPLVQRQPGATPPPPAGDEF